MTKGAKRRDVERLLLALGWAVLRDKGNHTVWQSPDGQTFAVPRHREVSAGVMDSLKKILGDAFPAKWK